MAGHGGPRPGSGRPKGKPNKATKAREEIIAAAGITPLEHMLSVLRDPETDPQRKDEMAKAAAPYVHPRLASIEQKGDLALTVKVEQF